MRSRVQMRFNLSTPVHMIVQITPHLRGSVENFVENLSTFDSIPIFFRIIARFEVA